MFEALGQMLASSFQRAPWGWGTLGLLIAGWFKLKPYMARLANERESSLREERAHEMAGMRERIEKLEAERASDRHRLNDVTTCLDALLLLLEMAPERAAEHVQRIKE